MENGFSSPRSDTFPAGLRVLVVDDDPTWLKILEKMLKKCSYEVTTCCLAREALKVLRERKDGFDIVISDVNMPDMDGFKLLEHVGLEMDLPVIMMSVDGETSRVMKGVQHGACDYLLKPVRMKELKNIWQHVFRKKIHEVKDVESYEVSGDNQMMRTGSGIFDDGSFLSGGDFSSVRKRKDTENKDLDDQDFNDPAAAKRARVVWSVDLHQKFVNAVDQIGLDKVGPKKILDLMNVPWLTRENVASHLQKYRLYLCRLQNQNEPRTSFGGIKQQDITPKDPPASFGLQSSVKVHQENTTNCNFGYSTNKILVQGVNPNFDEGDLKSIVSFSQRTELRKALTTDFPQKKSSGSQLGLGHSFGSLEMVVDYPSFEPTLSQQRSWNKEASVMQFSQPPKQEYKPSGYTHLPHSSPKLHIQANSVGLAPSIHHGNSLTERAKANPPETKILSTAYRNNHARNTSPTGLIIGSFSSHAETERFNLHGFGPNTTITESSSTIHQSFDQKSANNWDSNLLNLSPQSGSTLQSPLEVLQLYSLQDYDSIEHIGLTNLEYLDCHDVELFAAVPGQPYDRVRLHCDYLCDSMEYPCVDQGLFIA